MYSEFPRFAVFCAQCMNFLYVNPKAKLYFVKETPTRPCVRAILMASGETFSPGSESSTIVQA